MVGCQPAPARHVAFNVGQVTVIAGDHSLAGGSEATWTADGRRLFDDLRRAATEQHWGVLSLKKVEEPASAVRMTALLPDDRPAEVLAWPIDDDRVRVQVRIGRFGDGMRERAYLQTLGRILDGPPKRQRGGKFKLPDP